MLIRRCPIWLLGAVVVILALTTSGIMAARAYLAGDADSVVAALLAPQDAEPLGALQPRPAKAAGSTAVARHISPPAATATGPGNR